MAISSSLDAEARRAHLLQMLGAQGRITVSAAAGALGVSEMTLRRDLADLEGMGQLRRVRGGAVAPLQPRSFAERSARRSAAKKAIAQKALPLVPSQGTCAFDASSTAGVLLSAIGDAAELTAVTNSAENFEAVSGKPGISPILLGGHRHETTQSFVGPLADLLASSLHYGKFFTSAAAVDPEWGTSEATAEEAALKRTLSRHADLTILLADSSKLGSQASARALALDDVDVLITDLDPDDARLDPYRRSAEIR
ncbi:DeoR/GlpR family DNA-binding transcription regulator [Nesterenkonia sp.]|uniref:DeoR/GlpR family DNA-binding transcription regulator n=1 Tax=Nesterenkonia sp. TaxID=704201 RepID=UPI002604081A|nr:DeoR/GlpR family DNA-binding transcription regulator [Nesterenkonia sp.]